MSAVDVSGTVSTSGSVTVNDPVTVFGVSSPGASVSHPGAGIKFGSIFTVPASGTIPSIEFYAAGGSVAQGFYPLIYSVAGGAPSGLLATGPVAIVAVNAAAGWLTAPLTAPLAVTAGQEIFVGLLAASPSGTAAVYWAPTTTPSAWWNANGPAAPTASWSAIPTGNGSGTTDQEWSFQINLVPEGSSSGGGTGSGGSGSSPTTPVATSLISTIQANATTVQEALAALQTAQTAASAAWVTLSDAEGAYGQALATVAAAQGALATALGPLASAVAKL